MNHYQKEQQILQWLKDYRYIKASIKYLEESINDIAENGMGISYDKVITSKTNKINSVVENAVLKIDKQEVRKNIKIMKNIITAIDTALNELDNNERTVIVKRCIENKCYYQFTHTISVSERTARRLKKESLDKMSIIIFGSN